MSSRTVERYGGIWLEKVNKLNPVEFNEDLVTEKRVRDVSIDIFDKLKQHLFRLFLQKLRA